MLTQISKDNPLLFQNRKYITKFLLSKVGSFQMLVFDLHQTCKTVSNFLNFLNFKLSSDLLALYFQQTFEKDSLMMKNLRY